jgi:tetratricopeptide (TPR) repeat protein
MTRFAVALLLAFSSSLYAESKPEDASSILDKAQQLREDGKPLEAIKLLNTVLDKDPNDFGALFIRADCLFSAGEDRKAITEYEHLLKLKPSVLQKVVVFNNLAYLLAASPDDSARDGKRAIDLAETAQLLEEKPSADVLDTLAAAYAEAGQFDRAIETENKAIKLAPGNLREELQKYLKLFEDHKPRRENRAKNDQPPAKQEGAGKAE